MWPTLRGRPVGLTSEHTESPLPANGRGLDVRRFRERMRLPSGDQVERRAGAEPAELLLVHGVLELDGL